MRETREGKKLVMTLWRLPDLDGMWKAFQRKSKVTLVLTLTALKLL
jgi:hypothetical protein